MSTSPGIDPAAVERLAKREQHLCVYPGDKTDCTCLHCTAAATLRELSAANEKLRKDAERLDWLERQLLDPRCVSLHGQPPQGLRETPSWHVHLNGIGPIAWSLTAREALDAAKLLRETAAPPFPNDAALRTEGVK